jgi:DNA polymerase-3 subunit gamma/tau
MTYQVLARKWRPQDFESLVGQEPITTALRNALQEKRVAQAYLFSGIRGVGKTTAARVFAKALNCEREPGSDGRSGADPCNECEICREITSGADMDVLEIDAATYSKVEQVRELTESLRYGAARDRYKVVVLDEVHRLSRQAFDALLKIVEEPPPHLVFIFATTEIDAVPATILSRCQEFQFRRVPSPVLAAHLRKLADAESIEVSDPSLRMIARAGEGSVRDSVALLDQLATFGGSKISDQDANRLLGGLDAAVFRRLLGAVLAAEPLEVTAVVREIEENGWDPHHVYCQLLTYVRDAVHLALGGKTEAIDLPLEEAEALKALLSSTAYESLLQLSHLLLQSEVVVRRSELPLLALEIAWLRAAELPKVTRLEDLLSGRAVAEMPAVVRQPAAAPPPKASAPKASAPKASAPSPKAPPSAVAPEIKTTTEPPEPAAEEPPPPDDAPASLPGDEALVRLKEILSTRKPPLAARLHNQRLTLEKRTLVIHLQEDDPHFRKALGRFDNILREVLAEILGEGAGYEIRRRQGDAADAPDDERQTTAGVDAGRKAAEDNPTVQAVLDIFGGSIQNVNPAPARFAEGDSQES